MTRTVLRLHGIDDDTVRRQVAALRWQQVGSQVVATFTGPLPVSTRRWAASMNAGPHAVLSGRTALAVNGLDGWGSDHVQVVVDRGVRPAPLSFVKIHESRRHQGADVTTVQGLPWTLTGGARKAFEIGGMGHLDPHRWYADLLRAADIMATDGTPILRLPAAAARLDPEQVSAILHRYLGLPTPSRSAESSCQNVDVDFAACVLTTEGDGG